MEEQEITGNVSLDINGKKIQIFGVQGEQLPKQFKQLVKTAVTDMLDPEAEERIKQALILKIKKGKKKKAKDPFRESTGSDVIRLALADHKAAAEAIQKKNQPPKISDNLKPSVGVKFQDFSNDIKLIGEPYKRPTPMPRKARSQTEGEGSKEAEKGKKPLKGALKV